MEELRQKFGASLSERYQSQQQGTAKMMSDYDKLRHDLMKVYIKTSIFSKPFFFR